MQPKNSTTTNSAQLLTTEIGFRNECHGELFNVRAGVPAEEALAVARALGNGIEQLSDRLAHAIADGEIAYCDEVRALGFLGSVASSLVFSVERALMERECQV